MSHRPIEEKKRRRVAKAFKRKSLPAYFDLVKWLVDHGHAKSKREARDVILAGRVKSDSHTIGVEKLPWLDAAGNETEKDFVFEHVPVALRQNITVAA
jgi:hypothetical protein